MRDVASTARLLVVSIHDVGPAEASAAKRWGALVAHLPLSLTFLAIPGPWRGSDFDDVGDDGHDASGCVGGKIAATRWRCTAGAIMQCRLVEVDP